MSTTVKWVIGLAVAVLILPLIFLVLPLFYGVAHSAERPVARTPGYNCAGHHWTRFVGVSPYPGMLADLQVHAHVCWWTNGRGRHTEGQVIERKTQSSIKFHKNGWAETYGFSIWQYRKYETAHIGGGWGESVGHWNQWRVCQNVGVPLCDPTGNFVVSWDFVSPWLLAHSDGSAEKWDFDFHRGKPGTCCGVMDGALKYDLHD